MKDRSEKPVSIEVKQAAERIRVEAQSSKNGSGERKRKAQLLQVPSSDRACRLVNELSPGLKEQQAWRDVADRER